MLPRVRFSRPLAEPGVPITGHRALHGCCRRVVLRRSPRGWESCCLGSRYRVIAGVRERLINSVPSAVIGSQDPWGPRSRLRMSFHVQ